MDTPLRGITESLETTHNIRKVSEAIAEQHKYGKIKEPKHGNKSVWCTASG